MPRADFYLIDKPRFRDEPLQLVCALVAKAYAAGQPCLVLAANLAQAEALDDLLWSFDADSFIPHQIAGQSDDDMEVAVLIVPPGVVTQDRQLLLNLREEAAEGTFERVLEVVAADEQARGGSRQRWKTYKQRAMDVSKFDM